MAEKQQQANVHDRGELLVFPLNCHPQPFTCLSCVIRACADECVARRAGRARLRRLLR